MVDQFSISDRLLLKAALVTHIKMLRDTLIDEGTYGGLGNENTISLSQELDQYIYLYQTCFQHDDLQERVQRDGSCVSIGE